MYKVLLLVSDPRLVIYAYKKAPQVGFEPTTDRLTADCSTTELLWNNIDKSIIP